MTPSTPIHAKVLYLLIILMCLSSAENLLFVSELFGSVLCWVSAFCGLVLTIFGLVVNRQAGSAQPPAHQKQADIVSDFAGQSRNSLAHWQ
ncbi:hypothetical protein [Oceanospirillum linum]|uniref:hypothetical protein n=1 Tax=Oceanospirillum linum TaxID=966 RepID=UPI00111676C5|nr:hypothetical protein [Oceanospirillum linum]